MKALFRCNGATLPRSSSGYNVVDDLDWFGSDAALRIEGLEQKLVEHFTPRARDLLEVASYVYAADRLVSRGGADIYGQDWRRHITLSLAVRDPQAWSVAADRLQRLLGFLTEDVWEFRFSKTQRRIARPTAIFDESPYKECDCVALFSGGLDSLTGAVWDRMRNAHRPLLVSHRSHPVIDRRQRELFEKLNSQDSAYRQIQFWVHLRDRREREASQRSRSFLFLAAASVLARQFGIPRIHVFENGVLSINLPIAFQVVSTMASRTTHPRFIEEMRTFCDDLLGSPTDIELPFITKTRREVIELLRELDRIDLAEFSSSCAHPWWRSELFQHCGICSQCIDRRFAIEAAALGERDRTYERDIFTFPLSTAPEPAQARSLVEGYLRTYRDAGELSQEAFWLQYPELSRLEPYVPEDVLHEIYPMYRRQWQDIEQVLAAQLVAHRTELLRAQLPEDCLLRMVVNEKWGRRGQEAYADVIAEVARRAWEEAFRGRLAEDEQEVKQVLRVGLNVARMRLENEHPLFVFVAGIKAKPDLADERRRVWVEAKYVRRPHRTPTKISEEIAADIVKYEGRQDIVLFLVHDPTHAIEDRDDFIRTFESRLANALVRIV